MTNRLPWFRCFPKDLLGVLSGLDPDEALIFFTLFLLIFETGGPVRLNARSLSRKANLPERRGAKALSRLIEDGVLFLTADNRFDCAATHAEIEWREARQKDQSTAGKASAAKRQNGGADKENDASVSSDDANYTEKAQQNQRMDATAVERPFNQGEGEGERDKRKELGATIEPTVPHPKKPVVDNRPAAARPDETIGDDYIFAHGSFRLTHEKLAELEKAYPWANPYGEIKASIHWIVKKRGDPWEIICSHLNKINNQAVKEQLDRKANAEALAAAKTKADNPPKVRYFCP